MDIQHALTQAMRVKRQEEGSDSKLTLNVDITSPTFTDVNIRYTARKDGISASISTPTTGIIGLQLQGRIPSQLNAKLFSRYASAPEDDVDILIIKAAVHEAERMTLKVAYNMDAPADMLLGLKERIPVITASLNDLAEKYNLLGQVSTLKTALISLIDEAYVAANNQAEGLSQLSILFRNTVVQYHKIVQVFVDNVVQILRETQFKLPGSEELTTLPEVLKKLTTAVAAYLDQAIQMIMTNVEIAYTAVIDMIADVQVTMPIGTAVSGAEIIKQVKTILAQVVDAWKELESLDQILEKLAELQKVMIEKALEFVDTLKSDILDAVAIYINALYGNAISMTKNVLDYVTAQVNMEQINGMIDYIMGLVNSVWGQVTGIVSAYVPNAEDGYVKVNGGRLEIDIPINFRQ